MKPLAATLTSLLSALGLGAYGGQETKPVHTARLQKVGDGSENTEAQWKALEAFTPRLAELLERVRVKAEYLGFKGWPELPDYPTVSYGGREDLGDPLLNRIWSHPLVLWHANRQGQILDALVAMEKISEVETEKPRYAAKPHKFHPRSSDGSVHESESFELVLVEDVFGICRLTPTEIGIKPGTPLFRGPVDGERQERLPAFFKTGELWAIYQESDGSLEPGITVFHPKMGAAALLEYVETPSEHREGIEKDAAWRTSLKEKGMTEDQVDDEMAQDGHQCSGLLTTDLPKSAPLVAGMRWFEIKGRKYATDDASWQEWHGRRAKPAHKMHARKSETP